MTTYAVARRGYLWSLDEIRKPNIPTLLGGGNDPQLMVFIAAPCPARKKKRESCDNCLRIKGGFEKLEKRDKSAGCIY